MLSVDQEIQINKSMLGEFERLLDLERSTDFWAYLVSNNLTMYYIKQVGVDKLPNLEILKKIIAQAAYYEQRYQMTLEMLFEISYEENIPFALFKTVRDFGEIADGDVDIVIKEKDFSNWLDAVERKGFICKDDGYLSSICTKEGFMKIEPRVNISSYERVLLTEDTIWENIEEIEIGNKHFLKTTKAVDLFALLLNFIYGPKYTRLYEQKLLMETDLNLVKGLTTNAKLLEDLDFITDRLLDLDITKTRFPYFIDNLVYLKIYLNSILNRGDYTITTKIRQLLFFFYMKYEYKFFNKLHFSHTWY